MEITITKDLINKQADKIGMARWHKAQITPSQFRAHVIGLGGAFAVATYEGDRRKDDKFILSELIGLDFDEGNHTLEALLNHPLIGKYAGLIYASPSHTFDNPKWRVVFFLASPIKDKGHYADYVGRLLASIGNDLAGLDTVAKDSARLFFGHKLAPHDEGVRWYANDTARLPIAILDGLPRVSSANAKGAGKRGISAKITPEIGAIADVINDEQFTELAKNLPTQAQNALKILIATRKGRNAQLYATGRVFNDCLVSSDTAYSILHRACVLNGYIAKDGISAFESSFLSAYGNLPAPSIGNGKNDEDISHLNNLSFADEFSTAPNVMNIAYPYITQMRDEELARALSHRLVMVKSPTGTGKSTLQGRIIEFWARNLGVMPRVLVITHRRSLVHEIAEKRGFITYAEITHPSMRGVNTLADSNVTTFDSLWRYEGAKFDLVMIDEAVQALEHLASSSTLKADRITPLRVLEAVMKNARQTIAFDANFSHGAGCWLEGVLSVHTRSSIRLVNTTRPTARPLDIWHDRSAFLARVFATANDGFTTLACASVNDARIVNTLATGAGLRTLLVCSDNSDNQDVKEKIANINGLADIDLLIYSPSLGTGIDITRPVKGAYLMARPRPLSGDDLVQMLSRARHADTYGAFGVIPKKLRDEHTPLTSNEIYTDLLQITRATLGTLPDTDNGDYLNSARLYSILQSEKERQFCDRQAFIKSAIANGFTFRMSYATGHDEALDGAFRGAIANDKQWRKDTTLTIAPLSDEDIENLRKTGNMSYSAKMANLRYHIEFMTGQAIDEGLYTALNTPEKRARVNRLADILATENEVKIGNAKMNFGRAYQDILPRKVQRALMLELIAIMGYQTIADMKDLQNATRDELITPVLSAWLERNRNVIRQAFSRYRQTDNAITELRAFLRAYGVVLSSKQIRQGDGIVRVYSVDAPSLDEMLGLADKVLNATRARALARNENAENSTTAFLKHTPYTTHHTTNRGVKNPFGKDKVQARGVPIRA